MASQIEPRDEMQGSFPNERRRPCIVLRQASRGGHQALDQIVATSRTPEFIAQRLPA
jgi:hypothetical protein